MCAFDEIVLWVSRQHPAAWWLDMTQKLAQLGWKPVSTDQCL